MLKTYYHFTLAFNLDWNPKDNIVFDFSTNIETGCDPDFIRLFAHKIDWPYVSKHHTLSEDFIRMFKDKVDWNNIVICQPTLSEDFQKEFAHQFV